MDDEGNVYATSFRPSSQDLASLVDVAVQVIQYRKYPQAMTIRAKQMVQKVGKNFLGVVLNNINMSQDSDYYYYSGYYYSRI